MTTTRLTVTGEAQDWETMRGDTVEGRYTAQRYDPATSTWVALDLSAISGIRCTVRANVGGAVVLQYTVGAGITITDAATGAFTLLIPSADTVSLAAPQVLLYDIQVTEADGRVSTVTRGAWYLLADIAVTIP